MRLPPLALLVAAAIAAPSAWAAPQAAVWTVLGGQALPAASARAVAGDLKVAQGQVDAALKLRKKRFEVWQKAAASRDRAAQDVQRRKRAGASAEELEGALARALQIDEQAARARLSLLAAEADVARGGAALLRLYDALLVERRRAIENLEPTDMQRGVAVDAYQELAAQRDAVRRALLPVLKEDGASLQPSTVDLEARAGDDVEALLAKADLARDLEDRALRQAEAISRRLRELEDERSVARDVSGMVGRSQLFDEEDRRLLVVRQDLQGASATSLSGAARARDAATDANDAVGQSVPDGDNPAPQTPVSPSLLTSATPAAAPAFSQTEQGFLGPQTDASIAGMLSSSSVSLDELQQLEQLLRANARDLRARSQKLKSEARARARD